MRFKTVWRDSLPIALGIGVATVGLAVVGAAVQMVRDR